MPTWRCAKATAAPWACAWPDQRLAVAPARIATLKVPTLILWGGQDRLIPPDNAQKFARDIAGSKLVMFDDLGHVPHEEDPGRTIAPVKAFLGL
jgi:pimeloyl-ACP methyl ester carboxylesterase